MSAQHPTQQTYFKILIALLILLVLTVLLAFVDLGRHWGVALAFAIATTKAILILLFFMHVKFGPRATIAYAAAGFVWLGILIALTCTDYLTRNHPRELNFKGEPRYLMQKQ